VLLYVWQTQEVIHEYNFTNPQLICKIKFNGIKTHIMVISKIPYMAKHSRGNFHGCMENSPFTGKHIYKYITTQ